MDSPAVWKRKIQRVALGQISVYILTLAPAVPSPVRPLVGYLPCARLVGARYFFEVSAVNQYTHWPFPPIMPLNDGQ